MIYSRQHLLESPYRVQGNDTLERIARPYEVSPSLLAKINGIRDPRQLQPGIELKVFHGPFDAVIDLGRYELTLFLKNRYAGRFPIGIGSDFMQYMQRRPGGPLPTLEGQYTVRDKQFSPIYYGPDRVTMSPSDPNYPLGRRWIDLGSQPARRSASTAPTIRGTSATPRAEARSSSAIATSTTSTTFSRSAPRSRSAAGGKQRTDVGEKRPAALPMNLPFSLSPPLVFLHSPLACRAQTWYRESDLVWRSFFRWRTARVRPRCADRPDSR